MIATATFQIISVALLVGQSQSIPTDTPSTTADSNLETAEYPYRFLPADVLRDFPGMCFGSTALRLFQVGESWSLSPFCGVSSCLISETGHFMEQVQDCGPPPKPNPKCENVNANSTKAFPFCCPKYECAEGVELEYPTAEELQQLALGGSGQGAPDGKGPVPDLKKEEATKN